jgi:hypothetical protein
MGRPDRREGGAHCELVGVPSCQGPLTDRSRGPWLAALLVHLVAGRTRSMSPLTWWGFGAGPPPGEPPA